MTAINPSQTFAIVAIGRRGKIVSESVWTGKNYRRSVWYRNLLNRVDRAMNVRAVAIRCNGHTLETIV